MRLHEEHGRLDPSALGLGVLGVWLARQVALRPAVELAVLQDVEVLGWQVVTQVVAVVVVGPELARRRIECQTNRVAQTRREQVLTRAVEVGAHHCGGTRRSVAGEREGEGTPAKLSAKTLTVNPAGTNRSWPATLTLTSPGAAVCATAARGRDPETIAIASHCLMRIRDSPPFGPFVLPSPPREVSRPDRSGRRPA